MPAPIYLMLRKGLHAVTQKLAAEVLVSSLSTLLVMVLVSHLLRPPPPVAPVASRISFADREPAPNETGDATADFLERVALAHITAPKAAAPGETGGATNEISADASVPLPPRRHAAAQSHGNKERVAASAPKAPPQPPLAASEPTVAPTVADRPNALQYGMGLVATVGDFVSASDKRVVEGMASVGDALTSFVKKL
jgi:hypothetical protein